MKITGHLPLRQPPVSPQQTSSSRDTSVRRLPLALLSVAGLLAAALCSNAAVLSWSGGSLTTANWNDSANWGYAGIPANGDTLIFPAGQPRPTNTNNLSSLSLNQVRFVGAGGGYAVWGNSFTISGSIEATNTAGANTINNPITLGAAPVTVNVGSGTSLTLAGALGGSGGLAKNGIGTLTLSGSAANTYSGATTVNAGLLQLGKTAGWAIGYGSLTIGDGVGGYHADIVRYTGTSTSQLNTPVPITVNSSGLLDLNNHSDGVNGSLTLDDGDVETGTGILSLDYAPRTITVSGSPYISGNLDIGTGTCTIQGSSGFLYLYANVSGSADIVKNDSVTVILYGANTFTGTLTANTSGYIYALNNLALGATNGGTIINDSAFLALNNVAVTNEALTLNSSDNYALDSVGNVTNIWAGPVSLSRDTLVYVQTNGVLEIIGPITGTGGVTKWGPGALTFSGATANTYSGVTTVNEGQLNLNKEGTAGGIPSAGLVIGDGTGTDIVRWLRSYQVWSYARPVRINSSGIMNLNGFTDTASPLTMESGQITTGAGTVWLSGRVTVLPAATTATINGQALLSNPVVITNTGHTSTYDLTINAAISGEADALLTKTGAGVVRLTASNSFAGPVTIDQGTLSCWHSDALGNTNTPATVNSGGTLHIAGNLTIGLKPLVLNGPGWADAQFRGALAASDGASSWAGPITNASDSTLYVFSTRTLNLSGPISGPGGLTKAGAGTNILSGATANTYAGTTRVDAGTLVLGKSSGVKSVPGNLVIGDGSGSDAVILGSNDQIALTADVFIQTGGWLECGAFYARIDTLRGAGTVNFGTGGWLSVGQNNGTSAFDGPMTGVGYAPGYTLGKTGAGTFTLNGNATFSAGITHVYAGKLIVNGSLASAVTVDSTAALGGGGTVGALTANGTISPGASPGRLSCGNVTFGASSSLAIELNGNTVGSGYDQLNVGGSVNLTGAALPPLTVGFLPAEGDQFIIVNNDGSDAITNTFDGLAEGAVVSDGTGKFNFRVSYLGGSGNDVVLTMTNRALEAGDAVVWSGNGNGAVETNECNLLNLELRNITLSPVSGLQATLRSLSPGVAVVQPYSRYPNIPVLSTRTNESFFQLTTLPGFTCGAKVDLELQVATTSHGNLKVPFSLPSGVAGSAVRFNNNVTTAIPDGGFVDKTFAVSGITTPLKKVVVSLHITHTADSDLDIWLIGPDGTTVNLSSDNGGTGDDYGTDCADAFRTTFDSSAATSITAGSAPFAGLFRPEQSLAAFNEKSGAEANGTWTLRIADDTAGAVGSIRCCSLILHPTDCSPGSGICELCPDVTIKSYTGPTTPQQSQYFQANGVVSSCGAVKACPPAAAGVFPAESFTFQNGPADACITVDASNQSPSGSLVAAAYLGSFNPAGSLCVNYLGDAGYYINASHPSQSFSFNVPANAVFILNVVTDAGGIPYTLAVSGGNCRPLLNITRTGASNLELDWTTAAPAYRLEGASPLVGGAWTEIPPVPPVVVEGKFKVTETMSPTNYFYRLHKP